MLTLSLYNIFNWYLIKRSCQQDNNDKESFIFVDLMSNWIGGVIVILLPSNAIKS